MSTEDIRASCGAFVAVKAAARLAWHPLEGRFQIQGSGFHAVLV